MNELIFDHDRLGVYRLSIEYFSQPLLSQSRDKKLPIKRIVSMLTRMSMSFDGVGEPFAGYCVGIDYKHEHRDAEHEHERNLQ